MRKTILLLLLIIFSLLLTSCINYSDYKDVKIPDDNIGTVKIPIHWEFIVIDDWIHIVDTVEDEIIGVQYFKGAYYIIDKIIYDERIYNSYFDSYELISNSYTSGNSNGGNWGISTLKKEEITYNYRFVYFSGSEDREHDIEIIIIDSSIEDSVLSDIAKSYKK